MSGPSPQSSFIHNARPARSQAAPRPAFTLIELLIVAAIILVLLSLLVPAARGTIAAARGFRCQSSQRTVAFDFTIFADDTLHGPRGDDERDLRPGRFRMETFQDAQYGVDEFWSYGNSPVHDLPDADGRDPMRCPEVRGLLTLRRNAPCTQGGVGPAQSVSFGFNIRLRWSEGYAAAGRNPALSLTGRILEGNGSAAPSSIPLLMDVNGAKAAAAGQTPLFTGPSDGSDGLLSGDRYWWPGLRHNGSMNIAFIDGHVAKAADPAREPGWAWRFDAGDPVR